MAKKPKAEPPIVDGKPDQTIYWAIKRWKRTARIVDQMCSDPWWMEVGIEPPPRKDYGEFVTCFEHMLKKFGLELNSFSTYMDAFRALQLAVAAKAEAAAKREADATEPALPKWSKVRSDFAKNWIRQQEDAGTFNHRRYWPPLIAAYQAKYPRDDKPNLGKQDFKSAMKYCQDQTGGTSGGTLKKTSKISPRK